jgi:hypothetical protein
MVNDAKKKKKNRKKNMCGNPPYLLLIACNKTASPGFVFRSKQKLSKINFLYFLLF